MILHRSFRNTQCGGNLTIAIPARIDKQLADMENAVSVASSKNAFPEYRSDVTPGQSV